MWKRPFDFRLDAVALSVVLGDDVAVAAAKFAHDDVQLEAVPVQPMYRFCIEVILPNDFPASDSDWGLAMDM